MTQFQPRPTPQRIHDEQRPVETRRPSLDRCRQAGELVARALAREIR